MAAATTNASTQIFFWSANTFSSDQFSEVRLSNVTATVEGATVRASQTNNEYACRETTTTLDMGKIVSGGGFVSLGSVGITGVNGDVIRLEVSGTTLNCYRNGVLAIGPVTDSSLVTGQPGVWTGGTAATIDNWNGGNLHPTPKLDGENDWVQPQHFLSAVTIGDPAPTAGALSAGLYFTGMTTPITSASGNSGRVGQTSGTLTQSKLGTFDANGNVVASPGAGTLGITLPSKILFLGALCNNATAGTSWNLPTSNAATFTCNTGTNVQEGTLDFADGQSAQYSYLLTSDWTGAIDARLVFFDSSTSGTVVFQIATACTPSNGSANDDTAFNTPDSFATITLGSPANAFWETTKTSINTTGCSAGNQLTFKLSRTTDTAAGVARVKMLELTVRRSF